MFTLQTYSPLAVKQLINNTCQLKLQSGCLMWPVCLLVKYNIKVKSVCVCVSLSLWLVVKKSILIYLQRTCWHHEFEMTGSASWMNTLIRIFRDFKPILNLHLYCEHMPEERITVSKIDLTTYLPGGLDLYVCVYTPEYIQGTRYPSNIVRPQVWQWVKGLQWRKAASQKSSWFSSRE